MANRISRRNFLKSSAAAAGALTFGAGLTLPRRAFAQDAVTITQITSSDQVPYWQYVNDQFKADHPNVSFELIGVGYDQMLAKIVSQITSGAPLDVYALDIIWVGQFAGQGFTLPLDNELSDEERAAFLPGTLAGLQAGGQQMALPAAAWFKNLFYNTEIVQKMGLTEPPPTYEDLVDAIQKAQTDGVLAYPTGWGWNQSEGMICDWTLLLHAFGGQWFDDAGKWDINNENGVAALTYMVENLKNGVFDPASTTYSDRDVMNPYLAGDYMAAAGWGLYGWSLANSATDSKIVGKADVGLLYGETAAGTKSATCSGVSGIAVNSDAPNKDIAVEWIRQFTGIGHPENIQQAMDLSGMPPVQAWAWQDADLVAKNPALPKLAAQAEYMYSRPSAHVANYTEWSSMAQIELSKALTGQVEPKAALDTIVENGNRDFPGINF